LTVPGFAREHRGMDEELDPREAARARRRDREADAAQRDLLRPGMGKVFKQITDSWAEGAPPVQSRPRKKGAKGSKRPR
jgi:hypothetical protein